MSFFSSSSIKSAQAEKVKQFTGLTGASEKYAQKFLKEYNWNLEYAIDGYYSQSTASRPTSSVDQKKLSALFDKYKDADDEAILVEGTETLCEDLGVDPTDVVTLVLAWHLQCPHMCDFRRDGWLKGWSELGADTIEKMRDTIPTMRKELDDPAKFKEIYQFTFGFAKADGQKSLALETAVAFWELLLREKFQHLDLWLQFVQENYGKSISKDTWNQFLEFIRASDENFSNHDTESAWPVLIDMFVEYAKEKMMTR